MYKWEVPEKFPESAVNLRQNQYRKIALRNKMEMQLSKVSVIAQKVMTIIIQKMRGFKALKLVFISSYLYKFQSWFSFLNIQHKISRVIILFGSVVNEILAYENGFSWKLFEMYFGGLIFYTFLSFSALILNWHIT